MPKVVSRRAERRLDEIELFRLLTAVEKKPRDNRRILSVLRPTAEKVDELRGLPDKQLLDDWFTEFTRLRALQHRAADKEPDDRIIAIADERMRQILTSAEARLALGRTYVAVRVVTTSSETVTTG